MLRTLGAESVHSAADGAEAVRTLGELALPVDVVITDLMMPDVDGIELIPLLRKTAPAVALIFSSTDAATLRAAFEIAKAHGLQVLGTVAKPITAEKLLPLLNNYIPSRG